MGSANVGSASLKERVLINLAFLHAPEIGAHVTLGEGGIGDVDTSDGDQTRVPIEVPGGEWSWHDDWHGRGYLSSYQITVLGMFQHCNTIVAPRLSLASFLLLLSSNLFGSFNFSGLFAPLFGSLIYSL